jgi:hypothetical protein
MSLRGNKISLENMIVPHANLNLAPLGKWLFIREQLKPFFT